jgi:hypothetical protein
MSLLELFTRENSTVGLSTMQLIGQVLLFVVENREAGVLLAELDGQAAKRAEVKGLLLQVLKGRLTLSQRTLIDELFSGAADDSVAGAVGCVVLQLMILVEQDGEMSGPEKQRLVISLAKAVLHFSGLSAEDQRQAEGLLVVSINNFIKAKKVLGVGRALVEDARGCCRIC